MTANEFYDEMSEREAIIVAKKRRLDSLKRTLNNHREVLSRQKAVLYKEEKDVENLSKLSLGNLFNRLSGRMDDVAAKEEREYIEARVKYEELENSVLQMERERTKLAAEITECEKAVAELRYKGRNENPEVREKYAELEQEVIKLKSEARELSEAIESGYKVRGAIGTAIKKLEAAHGWATFDMFTRGGIISHMAKYGNIDDAQEIINRLGYLVDNFQSELRDVCMELEGTESFYDNTTRFVDFFFDNIFTDMRVRGRIEDDIDRLSNLDEKTERIVDSLNRTLAVVQSKIQEIKI